MVVTRYVVLAFILSLALGAFFVAPAGASGFVKRGASGHAYYWQSGC